MLTLENAGSVRWRCTLITVAYWCCYYCKWCCVATYDAILHTHCVALLSWGRKIGCFCSKSNPIQMLRVNLCIALYVQWNMQKITYSFVTPTCITFRYSNKLYKTTVTAVSLRLCHMRYILLNNVRFSLVGYATVHYARLFMKIALNIIKAHIPYGIILRRRKIYAMWKIFPTYIFSFLWDIQLFFVIPQN